MKVIHRPIVLAVFAVLCTAAQAHDKHAPLNEEQTVFLKQYEIARAALAANNLPAAKKATGVVAALTVIHHESSGIDAPPGFVQDARKFIDATSLEAAREIFKSYSRRAVNVADQKPGYFVVHCSFAGNNDQDWVQSTAKVGNPYLGAKIGICSPSDK